MRTMFLWGVCLTAGALAGCSVASHQAPGRFEGKLEARERLTAPGFTPIQGEDVCADNNWYGDGECDYWCPATDSDCGGGAVCAAFIEEGDGLCRRSDLDPCREQDPDCDVACPELPIFPGSDGVCSFDPNDPCVAQFDADCDGGIACDAYVEMSDGACSRANADKCRFQDPDCDGGGTVVCPAIEQFSDSVCTDDPSDPCVRASDPDCDQVVCTAIAYPDPIPDGMCSDDGDPCTPSDPDCVCDPNAGIRAAPPSDGICQMSDPCALPDPDCSTCGSGDAFFAPIPQPLPSDGICTETTDPCAAADPDCIACAEFIEVADGVCSRDPMDPCLFQDPDCTTTCDMIDALPPADGVCVQNGDPCNIDPDCQTCAFFAPPPPSDGVCSGTPDDPCSFQGDVDCGVVCAAFIEASDGQCNRYSSDACYSQDPDCVIVDCSLVDPNPTPDMRCPFTLDATCRTADPDCKLSTDA